jgi:hypothetical protein
MTSPFRPSTGMQPGGNPGQGGQPAVHPTVGNLGLPGAPVTIERPNPQPQYQQPQGAPQPQQGGWVMPAAPAPQQGTFDQQQQQPQYQQPAPQQQQQPQFQPHPTANYGQPQPQQQPQQNFQNQPAQRVVIPDRVIMDGESVPPELRGRTWGQVKQIYGALANDFMMRDNRQRQPQQPQQPQAYVQGEPNGGQPQQRGGRPQQGQAATGFWADPEGTIERIVDSRVAPITQRTTAMAIQEARNIAAAGIPDFQMLEGEIMGIVAGADPAALADPRLWQSTADLARGRLMGRGQYDPRQMQQQNGQHQQQNGQVQRGPGQFVPAPVSPVGQFFSEAPTPPQNWQGSTSTMNSITPEEQSYARKMQMTDEDYIAWRGGVIQTAPTRRY